MLLGGPGRERGVFAAAAHGTSRSIERAQNSARFVPTRSGKLQKLSASRRLPSNAVLITGPSKTGDMEFGIDQPACWARAGGAWGRGVR